MYYNKNIAEFNTRKFTPRSTQISYYRIVKKFNTLDLYYIFQKDKSPTKHMQLTSYWWGGNIIIPEEELETYGYRYIDVIFLAWISGIKHHIINIYG